MRKTAGHPGKKTASHAPASPPTGPAIHAAYSGPPPTANGDSYMVVHDHVLNVAASGVLANDSGGPVNGGGWSATTSHGAVTLNANGSFTYTAAAHFAGTDSFTYTASNANGTSNVASVFVSVTDNAPTIAQGSGYIVTHDHTLNVAAARPAWPGLRLRRRRDGQFIRRDPTHPRHGDAQRGWFLRIRPHHALLPATTASPTPPAMASSNSSPATVYITVNDGAPTIANSPYYTVTHDHTLGVAARGCSAGSATPTATRSPCRSRPSRPRHGDAQRRRLVQLRPGSPLLRLRQLHLYRQRRPPDQQPGDGWHHRRREHPTANGDSYWVPIRQQPDRRPTRRAGQ